MTIYVNGGQVYSVAKSDCPRCHGTGMYVEMNRDAEMKLTMSAGFCDCVKVNAGKLGGRPKKDWRG
jgi:hypothetical protein